ncbi:MAG: lactate racemase domain-containing protein, partial [Opitutaceae bacterium]
MPAPFQKLAAAGESLSASAAATLIARAAPLTDFRGQRVVLIIPDGTRTAPIGLMFKALNAHLAPVVKKLDVMIALGTHPAMTEEAINARVELTPAERAGAYR